MYSRTIHALLSRQRQPPAATWRKILLPAGPFQTTAGWHIHSLLGKAGTGGKAAHSRQSTAKQAQQAKRGKAGTMPLPSKLLKLIFLIPPFPDFTVSLNFPIFGFSLFSLISLKTDFLIFLIETDPPRFSWFLIFLLTSLGTHDGVCFVPSGWNCFFWFNLIELFFLFSLIHSATAENQFLNLIFLIFLIFLIWIIFWFFSYWDWFFDFDLMTVLIYWFSSQNKYFIISDKFKTNLAKACWSRFYWFSWFSDFPHLFWFFCLVLYVTFDHNQHKLVGW